MRQIILAVVVVLTSAVSIAGCASASNPSPDIVEQTIRDAVVVKKFCSTSLGTTEYFLVLEVLRDDYRDLSQRMPTSGAMFISVEVGSIVKIVKGTTRNGQNFSRWPNVWQSP